MESYIKNPKTNRFIKKNGTLHKKLLSENPELFIEKEPISYKNFKDKIKKKDPEAIEKLRKLAQIAIL